MSFKIPINKSDIIFSISSSMDFHEWSAFDSLTTKLTELRQYTLKPLIMVMDFRLKPVLQESFILISNTATPQWWAGIFGRVGSS